MNTSEEKFVIWLAALGGGGALLAMPIFLDFDDLFAVIEIVGGICVIGYALGKLYGVLRLPSPRDSGKKRFG
jgi:hypothetical protein